MGGWSTHQIPPTNGCPIHASHEWAFERKLEPFSFTPAKIQTMPKASKPVLSVGRMDATKNHSVNAALAAEVAILYLCPPNSPR